MRLFEAIIDANHRAVAGDPNAGLHPADFAHELPVVALTCIDPRLNALFPNVLALPADQFIWLRNAGNIIFDPMSSMTRTLALACAVKGGREIAIIGHTDCLVRKTSVMDLTNRFQALGIDRSRLPENLTEFFGLFASERQNVLHGVEVVRSSPLIGPQIPVHGLLVDVETGKLEWLVNGYQVFQTPATVPAAENQLAGASASLASLPAFQMGEMKFPETKIGEASTSTAPWLPEPRVVESQGAAPPPPKMEPAPKPIPLPPRIRPGPYLRKARK
jgi:carbonic anhydrase